MIKLDLTSEQLDSLLKTNFCRVDYGKPEPIHAGDTVQAADRLCHVTGVTDNTHFDSKRLSLRMGR